MPVFVDYSNSNPNGPTPGAKLGTASIGGAGAVEVHFRITAAQNVGGEQAILTILDQPDGVGDMGELFLFVNGPAVGVSFSNVAASLKPQVATWTPPFAIDDGAWHQLAVYMINGLVYIWVDGQTQTGSDGQPEGFAFAIGSAVNSGALLLGTSSSFKASGFRGGVTEVRGWNNTYDFVPCPNYPEIGRAHV